MTQSETAHVLWFETLGRADVGLVGGKNSSLGEMIQHLTSEGIAVPGGFATTAAAYRAFIAHNKLDETLREHLDALAKGERTLAQVGRGLRQAILDGEFPKETADAIRVAYAELSKRYEETTLSVAVRSSATAEDLPDASFAGQQESFLHIRGEDAVLDACKRCFASIFTDRAINYRQDRGFDHLQVALSVGVQKMVYADEAGAGVIFSIDSESGFPDVIDISATWGLGETIVQGRVRPDEYRVFKPKIGVEGLTPIIAKTVGTKETKLIFTEGGNEPTEFVETPQEERDRLVLDDAEVMQLAAWAQKIEKHYGCPMDIEWAKDGRSGDLFIVQARPETVHSQTDVHTFKSFHLREKGKLLVHGVAVGEAIAQGKVKNLVRPSEMDRFEDGDVLVTRRTDPDWGPIMKRASAIVTDYGGRTSHAAIVSRELGVPAVVGTQGASKLLKDGQEVTVSCAEGQVGNVYEGLLDFEEKHIDLNALPEPPVKLMLNLAAPDAAFQWWWLPVHGVGLARMEFIINDHIKIHPLALSRFDQLQDAEAKAQIEEMTKGYATKTEFFVDKLARGISQIAASQYPDQVILRMSDFKTNEYAQLLGGAQFEPEEENPMLGFRGASRYYNERYKDGFALECKAVKRAREEIGLDNIVIMLPFVRTPAEADRVIEVLAENGLVRGEGGLELYMMCEIPSNVFLAEEFGKRFDGFSIGSNDLTQLILGVDRDSEALIELFDERNPAVTGAIAQVIERAHKVGCKVGICGQAPSDHPDFARFLVEKGIDTISLNPDSVLGVLEQLADFPKKS